MQIILLSLFIFAAVAYGAVHYWAYSVVFGATFLLCAMALLQSGGSLLRTRRGGGSEGPASFSPFKGPFVFFTAAFLLFIVFQLVPLPGSVLKVLSPYSAYLYGQAHHLTVSATLEPNVGESRPLSELSGGDKPRPYVDGPGSGGDKPRPYDHRPGSGWDKPRPYVDGPGSGVDKPRAHVDGPGSGWDKPRAYGDGPGSGGDKPRAHGDRSGSGVGEGFTPSRTDGLASPGAALEPRGDFVGYISLDRDKTVKSLLTALAYLGFAFLSARTIRWSQDLNRFAILLIIFSLGLSLYGLFDHLFASQKTGAWKNPFIEGARVSATLINPDHFANYLVLAVYLNFGYLAAFLMRSTPPAMGRNTVRRLLSALGSEESHIPKAFLLLFVMAVMIFVMFYTLSRGAVIALCLSMFLTFLLLFLRTRRPVFLLLMIPALAFVAYYSQIVGVEPILDRIEQTRKEFMEFDDNTRTLAYRAGLDLWQRFQLFGSGLGCFEDVYHTTAFSFLQGSHFPYIHNDWLQMTIETGLIGILLLAAALVSLFVRILRRWWRTEDPWGVGLGLAAMGAMVAMAIHEFVDFSLRIPVNPIFLMVLVSLALVSLDEGFGAKGRGKKGGSLTTVRGRTAAGIGLISAAVVCFLLFLEAGRFGLAQYYCPTEIDSVIRRDYVMSASKLQNALRLNPLNGDYWLNLATFVEAADGNGTEGEAPAFVDGSKVVPADVPGWGNDGLAGITLQEWAFAEALERNPTSSGSWLSWADYLWEKLQSEDEGRGSALLQQTARSYQMAVELYPGNRAVNRRHAEFLGWLKRKEVKSER